MNVTPEKFRHLLEANRALSSTLDLAELLRQVMHLATEVVEAETSSLLLYEPERRELVFSLALTEKEPQLKRIRLKLGEGIAGWVAAEKRSQIVNNAASDPRWARHADTLLDFRTRSVLAVPLLFRGALLGVIEAINKRRGVFVQEDLQVLEAFAAQAAVAIENARTFDRLTTEKEKIEAVFSRMSDGVLVFDAAGRKVLANPAAARLLGEERSAKERLPEIFGDFICRPPYDELLRFDRGGPVEFHRTAGRERYFAGAAAPLTDAEGRPAGLLVIFRDVTGERKESRLKSDFLSLISHKLRTPLAAIIGYAPLLLADEGLSENQRKAVTSIQRQGRHLAALVDKLLYFVMADSESVVMAKSPASLQTVVEKALNAVRPLIEEKKAMVVLHPEVAALAPITMDEERIEAAVVNLLENAVKFNNGGEKRVEIGACTANGQAGIFVKDNGPGIEPEEQEKIFQKFYQIEEYFTGQVEGVGLGLALVKHIAELHGGRSWVQSVPGRGATFYFTLPQAAGGEGRGR